MPYKAQSKERLGNGVGKRCKTARVANERDAITAIE